MNQNDDRTNPDELIPLKDAADRLGIAYDTARKRVKARTLQGERRGGRLYAWVPKAESGPESSGPPPGPRPESSGPVPDALVATLRDEIAFLRGELAGRTEEIRRRDHIIAGLVESMRALPASTEPQTMPQERAVATERDDQPAKASATLVDRLRRLVGR